MTKKYTYDFPRPSVTADCAVFGWDGKILHVLLIERLHDPYKGKWALPGGFFDMEDVDTDHAAARELEEETGLKDIPLVQFHVFSKKNRDPRGRTVTVSYLGFTKMDKVKPKAGDDAADFKWFNINNLPEMAFDHNEMLAKAIEKAKVLIGIQSIENELFGKLFSKDEIQNICACL